MSVVRGPLSGSVSVVRGPLSVGWPMSLSLAQFGFVRRVFASEFGFVRHIFANVVGFVRRATKRTTDPDNGSNGTFSHPLGFDVLIRAAVASFVTFLAHPSEAP